MLHAVTSAAACRGRGFAVDLPQGRAHWPGRARVRSGRHRSNCIPKNESKTSAFSRDSLASFFTAVSAIKIRAPGHSPVRGGEKKPLLDLAQHELEQSEAIEIARLDGCGPFREAAEFAKSSIAQFPKKYDVRKSVYLYT